jgi:hypothetical protein
MKPTNVLPPGAVLPPLATVDAKGVNTRQASRKGGKRHARGPKRHSGRFATLNGFVDCRMAALPRAAALVWLALFRDTKPDGLARTGTADLARRVGCDPSSVKRAVRLLVDAGHLEVVRRGGLGRGPSIYRVK